MDPFAYSERLLQLMTRYNITSMSVNNLTRSADKRHLLALAEKYGIGVICYTDVCQGGFDEKPASLRAIEIKARRTVNDIGDYPSLLAYIRGALRFYRSYAAFVSGIPKALFVRTCQCFDL